MPIARLVYLGLCRFLVYFCVVCCLHAQLDNSVGLDNKSKTVKKMEKKNARSQTSSQEAIYFAEAEDLLDAGLWQQALLSFQDFSELFPNSLRKYLVLEKIAYLYKKLDEYELAAQTYHRLYEMLGKTDQGLAYYFQTAQLRLAMGDNETAINIYVHIIKNNPNSIIAQQSKRNIEMYDLLHAN